MQVMMLKAEEKGLSFTNSFCDTRLSDILVGDPFRLNQILLNLISNAIKFTEKGGVDISCTLLHEDELAQTVKVEVKDTGIGMDESFAKNIFRKYSQENTSTTRLFGGTGLGMSICEELIRLMGGQIEVKSKKGEGTTVTFMITFRKGTNSDLLDNETDEINTSIIKDKKILVTDDNEMNRLVASAILEEFGAVVEEAKNGIEAIAKIKKTNYDIVLMDIQMPEMDGVQATAEIRTHISKTLPVIALTAFAIKGDNDKFIQAGMDDYLSKPFEEKQLLKVICRSLEKTQEVSFKTAIKNQVPELYDLNKLNDIAKGNTQFVRKMISLFIEQTPLTITELHLAYKQNDFERLRYVIQRLKPTIDNLNIVSLKNQVQKIELYALDKKNTNELTSIIRNVDTVIKKIIKSLQENVTENK
jgi:CheY-like chemotaxis protein